MYIYIYITFWKLNESKKAQYRSIKNVSRINKSEYQQISSIIVSKLTILGSTCQCDDFA